MGIYKLKRENKKLQKHIKNENKKTSSRTTLQIPLKRTVLLFIIEFKLKECFI